MTRSLVVHVVGARPNFVKMASVVAALEALSVAQLVVHTGQHYDRRLSADVLDDLGFPEPDVFLGIGSGTHAEQVGKTMISLERLYIERQPAIVVVAGDVNATLAAALAAAKLGVPIAHVESGLRSGDWAMPEEINRVLTDRLSSLLFTHSPEAHGHLEREGIDLGRVHYVGNTMIDALHRARPAATRRAVWSVQGLPEGGYILVTLHRPSNVDDDARLLEIAAELASLGRSVPIVFPAHPRTGQKLAALGVSPQLELAGVRIIEPLSYIDFLSLEVGAGAIVTDSGGVQEEAAELGVACFTFRSNTERPVTISHGTNVLLGADPSALRDVRLLPRRQVSIPLWDGNAGKRVAATIFRAMDEGRPRGMVEHDGGSRTVLGSEADLPGVGQ